MANLHMLIFAFLVSSVLAATVIFDGNKMPTIVCFNRAQIRAGKPSILHRTTNATLIRQNRRKACGKIKCKPRFSCDEYPFASTYEGGNGAAAKCVPAGEQNVQGGTLSAFYKNKKIGDRTAFDVDFRNVPRGC